MNGSTPWTLCHCHASFPPSLWSGCGAACGIWGIGKLWASSGEEPLQTSAYGTKQTSKGTKLMSAFDPKRTLNAHCARCDAHAMFPSVVSNLVIVMQLNYPPLLLMAFLAVASAQAFGQEKDLLSAEYAKCIEQSGGTDPGMLDCMGAEAERQDKRLNDVYKKLMDELKPERKKELQEVQRLWIKYTEANCNFYLDPDGGTAARLAASECPVLAKAARAKELENFIQ